jgi:hypothetical protein
MPQASGNAMPVGLSGVFLINRGQNATQARQTRCAASAPIAALLRLRQKSAKGIEAHCALNYNSSVDVLDDGVRPISATGGFRVPLALVILVLDCFRVAGDLLFIGGRPRGSERGGMSREGL